MQMIAAQSTAEEMKNFTKPWQRLMNGGKDGQSSTAFVAKFGGGF